MRPRTTVVAVAAALLLAFGVGGAVGFAGADPAVVSVDAPAPTEDPVGPHDAFIARLPAEVYAQCTPDSDRQDADGGRVTSLTCLSAAPGADEILVSQWVSAEEMLAEFAVATADRTPARCSDYDGEPAIGHRSLWGLPGQPDEDPLSCYINSNGAAVVMWEYPDVAVQVLGIRRDGDAQALFAWWRTVRDRAPQGR